ncbi:hypothetical protein VVD49_04435 [Uliginosibacterium sp. H3]|uniref:DUF5610 domain-containing protein n=1 Tax=Uliginosibacterium silvisoli TaxID=3114758 RepID=A0ABU6K0H1_9RHOO|nr:hypothetical protein [Uliginosibacterium sp. H3]
MSIQLPSVTAPRNTTAVTNTTATPVTTSTANGNSPQEIVSLGGSKGDDLTYADPRTRLETERPDLARLLADSKQQVDDFMAFLQPLLEQQGLAIDKVVSGEQKLSADPATIEKAKAAIAPDGEFGVTKVAERILNFAKFGIGDDPEKIETFRAAIQKGFDEAQAMLGGKLPEISQQTHKAIMDELDRWAANGIPSGNVSLAPAPAAAQTVSA